MKAIGKILLGLAFVCAGCTGKPQKAPLEAEIQNASARPDGSAIDFDFVLRNNSPAPISIAERWNSWGAFQWTVRLQNADGTTFEFVNPQGIWYKNYLTVATITPGSEHRSHFKLVIETPRTLAECDDAFAVQRMGDRAPLPHFSYPLKLVGTFSAPEIQKAGDLQSNWTGSVRTAEIKVEKPAATAKSGPAE